MATTKSKESSESAAVQTTPARVLQDCAYGRCGSVAQVPAGEIEAARASGLVDDHPDAVAYASAGACTDSQAAD